MSEMKYPATPIRVLLGGGIGSGKSRAGGRLEQHGATVVEADRLGHAVLEPDGEAFDQVCRRWPSVVVDRRVDRGCLAKIVFSDSGQLAELEAMTHPAIVRRISELAGGSADLVVEVPLILNVRGDWMKLFVDADEEVTVRRAVERGSDEVDVRRRMANQPSRVEWTAWADEIIDNNGTPDALNDQIDAFWHGLRTTDDGLRKSP